MSLTISDIQLMRLQADLLFVHDREGRMLYVDEPVAPEDHPAPIIFVGRTQQGSVCRFRWDVPEEIQIQVQDTVKQFDTHDMTEYRSLVSELGGVVGSRAGAGNVWNGPAYRFPDAVEKSGGYIMVSRSNCELLDEGFRDIVPELDVVQPCVAVVVDGRAVSICRSVRKSAYADEAGVETLPEYRQRRFGIRVVAIWASLVRGAGRIPLYSTSWSNTASRGLAAKLGLIMYGTDLHISER